MLFTPFAILILITFYIILGFLLAWISNMITRDEMTVTTGVVILVVAGITNLALSYALRENFPAIAGAGVNLVVLATMIWLIGKVEFVKSLLIALIFSVVIFLGLMALGGMMA